MKRWKISHHCHYMRRWPFMNVRELPSETVLTPWSWTHSFQNRQKIDLCCRNPPNQKHFVMANWAAWDRSGHMKPMAGGICVTVTTQRKEDWGREWGKEEGNKEERERSKDWGKGRVELIFKRWLVKEMSKFHLVLSESRPCAVWLTCSLHLWREAARSRTLGWGRKHVPGTGSL